MNPTNPGHTIQRVLNPLETFSDSRTHYTGPSRYVRLPRVTPGGPAAIAKSEDGTRCAVAGKESLRIVRVSPPGQSGSSDHKTGIGPGGCKIEASRNFWDSSGLKMESTNTDVAWAYGSYSNKILTSARNGELIMWDLNRSGAKYERKSKDHIRSINKLSVSPLVPHYCITGSADGDMRIWDLRDLTKSLMRVRHPTSIRSVVFSPVVWQPLQAIVGLDNGAIHRWDLKMGQRGGLDRLSVAHSGSVTTLDWSSPTSSGVPRSQEDGGLGWLVSGGFDRCVKVWDLTSPSASSRIPSKPSYVMHPSFPVRRIAWRPGYECELAVVSNDDVSPPTADAPVPSVTPGLLSRVGSGLGLDAMLNFNDQLKEKLNEQALESLKSTGNGEVLEIWDVRREWLAKWSVPRASADGSIADIVFSDSHSLWAQYSSGTFSQLDLREAHKPILSVTRVASTWDVAGSLTFVTNKPSRVDPPYDDVAPPEKPSDTPRPQLKAIGDPPVRLKTQAFSTFITEDAIEDLERFTFLARNYRIQGASKQELCELNAEVAQQAGFSRGYQIWLLMAATFSEPKESPSPPPEVPPALTPHLSLPPNHSNLPSAPTNYSFPPSSASNEFPNKWSPSRRNLSLTLHSRSPSQPRRLTPSSSTNSSPHHLPNNLPITPNRAASFNRRTSVDANAFPPSRSVSSAYRRPSLTPFTPSSSSSLADQRTTSSLRHVGEGALDDSSSSSDGTVDGQAQSDTDREPEGLGLRPLLSPALASKPLVAPSPLSRVALSGHWSGSDEEAGETAGKGDEKEGYEEEDEASSPSPRSTDTESDGSSHSRRQAKSRSSRRVSSIRLKSRSRSSTIASLAAPPRLVHQDSRSSIRTVIAGETSGILKESQDQAEHLNNTPVSATVDRANNHRRLKSQPISELAQDLGSETTEEERVPTPPMPKNDRISRRKTELVRSEEKRFRDMVWAAIKSAFDLFIEEGDVQTSAMICLLASRELSLPASQITRILDCYLDRLMRLRLYTCAAFIRKHSPVEELRSQSLVETVIYSTCARCHKPIMRPAIPPTTTYSTSSSSSQPQGQTQAQSTPSKGAYAFCLGCRAPTVKCSICHLPVRSLLFQCSVCNHGGHQACYRKYYMEHPMLELPSASLSSMLASSGHHTGRTGMGVFGGGYGRYGSGDGGAGGHGAGGGGHFGSGDEGRGRQLIRSAPSAHAQSQSIQSNAPSVHSQQPSQGGSSGSGPTGGTSGSGPSSGPASGAAGGSGGNAGNANNPLIPQIPSNIEDDASSMISASSAMGTANSTSSPTRTEQSLPSQRLMGHPCATGCGHYCWAANMVSDDS